jgi:hypothetical protein
MFVNYLMDINMTPKQFDICLVFHLGLIRCTPLDKTIDDARAGVTTGAAGNLRDALNKRFTSLVLWDDATDDYTVKAEIYNKNNTRNPSDGAFQAAFDVINGRSGISLAARLNKVNYQSVKVLIPRLKRWDEYAKKLAKTL